MTTDQPQDMTQLYPFLYADTEQDMDAVLAEVRASTSDKARQIVELRGVVGRRHRDALVRCAMEMAARFADGARLFAFGNGGSSTDADDVATTYLHPSAGEPLPALSLSADSAVVTALSNDISYDVVFSRQLGAFGRRGDIAFGLSTSGGSTNVVAAFEEAARGGMLTIGLAGYDGGRLAEADTLDYLFVVPSPSVHRIQEAQTTLYHLLWELTQQALSRLRAERADAGERHAVAGEPRQPGGGTS